MTSQVIARAREGRGRGESRSRPEHAAPLDGVLATVIPTAANSEGRLLKPEPDPPLRALLRPA